MRKQKRLEEKSIEMETLKKKYESESNLEKEKRDSLRMEYDKILSEKERELKEISHALANLGIYALLQLKISLALTFR